MRPATRVPRGDCGARVQARRRHPGIARLPRETGRTAMSGCVWARHMRSPWHVGRGVGRDRDPMDASTAREPGKLLRERRPGRAGSQGSGCGTGVSETPARARNGRRRIGGKNGRELRRGPDLGRGDTRSRRKPSPCPGSGKGMQGRRQEDYRLRGALPSNSPGCCSVRAASRGSPFAVRSRTNSDGVKGGLLYASRSVRSTPSASD